MANIYTAQDQQFFLSRGAVALKGAAGEPVFNFGRLVDPAETERIVSQLAHRDFYAAAPQLKGTGATAAQQDVFYPDLEQKVLGRVLASWDQSSIGSCVSHGWGRAVQDVLLIQIQMGGLEEWPGAEVCREAIYGGSRIEIGHSPGGEGSVGAWAAAWVKQYGILLYLKYPSLDLTGGYTVARCRQWGDRGVPKDLEDLAKQHPCPDVVPVTTPEQMRDAICNFHPVAICGDTSRPMKRQPGGWCPKTGNQWGHCESERGHFVVKGGSSSPFGGDGAAPFAGDVPAFAEQNSWGDYLGSENNQVTLASGREVTLSQGMYLSTYADRASDLRQGDTFAVASAKGWPRQTLDYGF